MSEQSIVPKGSGNVVVDKASKDQAFISLEDDARTSGSEQDDPLHRRRALWAWLTICFSTGPTFSVSSMYVPAVLQSMTNLLGHRRGSSRPCARRGDADCLIRFGAGEVNYNSYVLYLNAIARACDGACTVLTSGVADFSHYRKILMIAAILIFGALALPFAGLDDVSYKTLSALSALYATLSAVNGVYATMEASYIPHFMAVSGMAEKTPAPGPFLESQTPAQGNDIDFWKRGSRVSVYGLVAGDVGAITALIIGIIISYTRGALETQGYGNYLLAITIAGCLTVALGTVGWALLPTIKGEPKPRGNLLFTTVNRWFKLFWRIPQYPQAFKFVVGWILWNTAYVNFLSIASLLFRETYGINITSGDSIFTVYSCTSIIFASMGSLGWTWAFPRIGISIKSWALGFLTVNMLCIFWGCIGISNHVNVGYKHGAEFWVAQVLFMSTSSALRATNRVIYSSMIPVGREAQFFGLELSLDLATGWIGPLVTGLIQNSANNLRVPMVVHLVLVMIATGFYLWSNIDKGREDAKRNFV